MPKALKWGILIAACILLLFVIGHIFQDHIGELFGKFFNPSAVSQEADAPFSGALESAPWETEIHSTGEGENH